MGEFNKYYLKEINIGKLKLESNVLMAPLAGYTCFPFRLMAYEMGAGAAYTEMVSVNGLKYNDAATSRLLYTDEREKLKCVQLLGSDPKLFEMVARSKIIEPFDLIDINMGCPVPNVVKDGAGCSLVKDIRRASKIIEACVRSGKTVTVKMRPGFNDKSIVIHEMAVMCEESGASMITVHGRTRDMMFSGEPLYELIAIAKDSVDIPVIANGGINDEESAVKMMKQTGADGIMLARYGFENPILFAELTGKKIKASRKELIIKQTYLAEECYSLTFALEYIRKLAGYFMKKVPGTKKYRIEINKTGSIEEIRKLLTMAFDEASDVSSVK